MYLNRQWRMKSTRKWRFNENIWCGVNEKILVFLSNKRNRNVHNWNLRSQNGRESKHEEYLDYKSSIRWRRLPRTLLERVGRRLVWCETSGVGREGP